MFLTLLLPPLENIINRALKADPEALQKITAIKNQVIEINCDDWNMQFFIIIDSNGLQFHKKYSTTPNTIIHGTLNNFLHIFMKGADTKTVFHYPIEITGNTHNIEVLRDVFKHIDIDFEEKLSHYVGDTIAHKLCYRLNEINNNLKASAENITDQVKEFIHYEAKNLISHQQAEKFYDDVAVLRNDVDRIEARINQLMENA